MTKKTKVIVAGILVIILIVAGYFLFFTSKSNRLTVTDIHDNVVLGQTTKKDLEERYGKPSKVINDKKKINAWTEIEDSKEGSLDENLNNFWNTLKFDRNKSPLMKSKDKYQYAIEYKGKNLGISFVRFYFWKNSVYGIHFSDEINDKNSIKNDKYLRKSHYFDSY